MINMSSKLLKKITLGAFIVVEEWQQPNKCKRMYVCLWLGKNNVGGTVYIVSCEQFE